MKKEYEEIVNKYDGNFRSIFFNETLSEDFIREFQDKVDWDLISKYQALTEKFIEEFQDKVNWINVALYQFVSYDFLKRHIDQIRLPQQNNNSINI